VLDVYLNNKYINNLWHGIVLIERMCFFLSRRNYVLAKLTKPHIRGGVYKHRLRLNVIMNVFGCLPTTWGGPSEFPGAEHVNYSSIPWETRLIWGSPTVAFSTSPRPRLLLGALPLTHHHSLPTTSPHLPSACSQASSAEQRVTSRSSSTQCLIELYSMLEGNLLRDDNSPYYRKTPHSVSCDSRTDFTLDTQVHLTVPFQRATRSRMCVSNRQLGLWRPYCHFVDQSHTHNHAATEWTNATHTAIRNQPDPTCATLTEPWQKDPEGLLSETPARDQSYNWVPHTRTTSTQEGRVLGPFTLPCHSTSSELHTTVREPAIQLRPLY
jgi:hypothetical protein